MDRLIHFFTGRLGWLVNLIVSVAALGMLFSLLNPVWGPTLGAVVGCGSSLGVHVMLLRLEDARDERAHSEYLG